MLTCPAVLGKVEIENQGWLFGLPVSLKLA